MSIKAFRAEYLPILRQHLERKAESISSLSSNPVLGAWLSHAVHLSQGGKCLRSYLANRSYAANGGTAPEAFVRTSVFFEIFHLFAVIQDDVIDEGKLRHGLPTEHKFIEESLKTDNRSGRIEHIAEGQAILVGDLLLSWAYEAVVRANLPGMLRDEVLQTFQEMIDHVITGEMLDIDLCTRDRASSEQIRLKSVLKSAHYSMMHPLVLGAAFAGSAGGMATARAIGEPLGIAFQLQDDLIDITGTEGQTGRTMMNDIAEGQHTFFTQHVEENGTDEQRATLRELKWQWLSAEQAARAQRVFADSGAIAAGEAAISEHYDRARMALESSDWLEGPRSDLLGLIEDLRGRKG